MVSSGFAARPGRRGCQRKKDWLSHGVHGSNSAKGVPGRIVQEQGLGPPNDGPSEQSWIDPDNGRDRVVVHLAEFAALMDAILDAFMLDGHEDPVHDAREASHRTIYNGFRLTDQPS